MVANDVVFHAKVFRKIVHIIKPESRPDGAMSDDVSIRVECMHPIEVGSRGFVILHVFFLLGLWRHFITLDAKKAEIALSLFEYRKRYLLGQLSDLCLEFTYPRLCS
jgi:hypothetical protein